MLTSVLVNNIMKKLLLLLLFLQLPISLSAIILKTEKAVTNILENQTGSLIAVSDEDSVTLFETVHHTSICTLPDKNVTDMSFYSENGSYFFTTLSKDGNCTVRQLAYKNGTWLCNTERPYFTSDCSDPANQLKLVETAFSSSDYIAAAFNDNSILLHFRLRATHSSITKTITSHNAPVYGLEFSKNGEYLATVSNDGDTYIWSVYNSTEIAHFGGVFTKPKIPVYFTEDSQYIISLESKNTIRISNLTGEGVYSIENRRPITAIKPLKNPDLLAIQNDRNEIIIFRISTSRPNSYCSIEGNDSQKASQKSDFTVFEVDVSAEHIYAGYKNGTVHTIETQPYLDEDSITIKEASPTAAPPVNTENDTKSGKKAKKADKKAKASKNKKQSGKSEQSAGTEQSDNSTENGFSSASVTPNLKQDNSFSICAGANYMQVPYLVSGNLRGEYLYSKKISPFYIGGGLMINAGFPRKDFPASYIIKGETVTPPKALAAVLYIPLGYYLTPWNNDITVKTTFRTGAKVTAISLISKEGYIIGDPAISFFASAGIGMRIKYFEFDINCEYYTIGMLSPSVYAGFAIKRSAKK